MKHDPQEVLARISPHPIRRTLAVGFSGLLGLILIYIAAASPPRDLVWLAFLVVMGAGMLWLSWRQWQATARTLELTREELRETGDGGRVLARMDDVVAVDRGFFAFKPASGFRVRLKEKRPRAYAPGLWWRSGRTLMVGGATSGAEAKTVADLMKVMLAERDR